jgi:putative Mg2+ transporter-C (MgtC) family protein
MGAIDWGQILAYTIKILIAFAVALPIAWERESATRSLGLRTFPLVAVASCSYVLVAIAVVGRGADAQARIIQGLLTGIGFIGGGAILKEGDRVRGTATAASIWTTGSMGAAVGYGQYEIAIIVSLVNFFTFRLLTPIERWLGSVGREEAQGDDAVLDDRGELDVRDSKKPRR